MDMSSNLPNDGFDAITWLNARRSEAQSNISKTDTLCIPNFCLMWNLFESVVCGKKAGVTKFEKEVNSLQAKDCLAACEYEPYVSYFAKRYISEGTFNIRFEKLNFRNNDKRELVEEALQNALSQPSNKITALLLIVYRLRNNLFHGIKDVYELTYQAENFEVANRVLATFLDDTHRCA